MNRRNFLFLSQSTIAGCALSGCALWRIDLMSPFVRSEHITSPAEEAAVLARAKVGWTEDGRMRVVYVQGTPYEMGYQQGALLRSEIQENLGYIYDKAVDKLHSDEIFDEAYERMNPFIPQRYREEMHGLAHGAKLPLRLVHGIHVLPDVGEWGGKKKVKNIVKKMMRGELGTSCSNFFGDGTVTKDGKAYVVRILDWGLHRISKMHKFPTITVARPSGGIPYANIGWAGFLGAISGMNAAGITLGEMGYGDPDNETLQGIPMGFLLREVLWEADSLAKVRELLANAVGTNSFIFLMSDGKAKDAEMYLKDRDNFMVFRPGQGVQVRDESLPPIANMVYGGHYRERMSTILQDVRGAVTPEMLQREVIPKLVMSSNFQNVIYSPEDLTLWVANAVDADTKASEAPYSFFNFGEALQSAFPQGA